MSVAAISTSLGIGWDLVNQVALDQARELVYSDPTHLAGVRVLGVDEHKWKHRRGDGTHWVYQDIIAAYEHPDRRVGKRWMYKVMCRIRKGLPAGVQELGQLGRTMWKRRAEILAYFDTGASNGPVEAINGRLEHLRGIALGFRNLNHYILRSLIHSGQLQGRINAL